MTRPKTEPRSPAVALLAALLVVASQTVFGLDDPFDRLDENLTFGAAGDLLRARLSGTLDVEGYDVSPEEQGLIFKDGNTFINPRLSLFLDVQAGPVLYAFAQLRADNGFDPGEGGAHVRADEYVLRLTPWGDGRLNLQVGKFATVVGNWTPRHGSWENPFITAPLPYEDLTGIWVSEGARSVTQLLAWAGVLPKPDMGNAYIDRYRSMPIIWGPSYASGASVFGDVGRLYYAVEVKNASLSSPPEEWAPSAVQWQNSTFSGRVAFVPNEMWTVGFSLSQGPYLEPAASAGLPPGRGLDRYVEDVAGQDVGFAWHHFEAWAEAFEARFAIPGVGNADTQAYYVEGKFKFTPQFFGSLRWNQQFFSSLPLPQGGTAAWGRNTWRVDAGPAYRITPHVQVKLQYSVERQDADLQAWSHLLAVQLTCRF